jgi:hypothetical protein
MKHLWFYILGFCAVSLAPVSIVFADISADSCQCIVVFSGISYIHRLPHLRLSPCPVEPDSNPSSGNTRIFVHVGVIFSDEIADWSLV